MHNVKEFKKSRFFQKLCSDRVSIVLVDFKKLMYNNFLGESIIFERFSIIYLVIRPKLTVCPGPKRQNRAPFIKIHVEWHLKSKPLVLES